MKETNKETIVSIGKVGTIGNLLSNYIDESVSSDEINEINMKIDIMKKRDNFNSF